MNRENAAMNQAGESKEELIGVLTAISVVSKRLAKRLAQLEKLPEQRESGARATNIERGDKCSKINRQ